MKIYRNGKHIGSAWVDLNWSNIYYFGKFDKLEKKIIRIMLSADPDRERLDIISA